MAIACPRCGKSLADTDVNVGTDVGACKACGNVFRLSEAMSAALVLAPDELTTPPGAWFTRGPDGFELGATTRSYQALFLVPFMCVWSGLSLGGIYGTQLHRGRFELATSLFGIPFLLGSLFFWSVALMSIAGKTTLTVRGDVAETFVGVGPIGWRKRFAWSGVRSVVEETRSAGRNGTQTSLFLQGETRVSFASGISGARRSYLLQLLRGLLRG